MKRSAAKKPLHVLVKLALATGLCSTSVSVLAANWSLADHPLYLGSSVPANILFMTDDSGSMDWDVMTRDYANDGKLRYPQPDGSSTPSGGGLYNRAGCSAPYEYAVQFNSTATCDTADDLEWRFRNADFNPLYFNPRKQYKPWSGTDQNGVAFGNIDPAQAWDDPYTKNYSGTGSWINVTTRASAISIIDNVALAQKPTGAGALVLNGYLISGGTLTLATADKLTFTSTGNISSRTFTITGTSSSGAAQSEARTGPNNSTVTTTKTWKTVTSITISGSAAANVTVGTNSTPASGDNHALLAGGLHFSTWTDSATNPTYFDNGEQTDYQVGNLPAVIPSGWYVGYDADPKKAVQINFANWLSYYRARHLVAKSALSSLVANTNNMRIGFATLHNNGTVNTPMSLVDTTAAGEANRKTLLDNIYKNFPNNGTPLRVGLRQAGEYLSGNTSAITFASPVAAPLPLASGGACQQNFTLLMTDGFYNDTTSDYTSSMSTTVGNADGDKNSSFDDKLVPAAFTPKYGDNITRTLADIAMYYYERDIIPGVVNNVPVIAGVDNATHQHMVTFSVAFGLNGNLKGMPEDYAVHKPPATDAAAWNNGVFPGWPTASGNNADNFSDKQRIDDLRHAAYNGRGEFIEANDPDSLADGLTSMINSIQGRIAASAALAFNSTSLHSNSLVFQARYDTTDWTGELRYLPLASSGDLTAAIANTGTTLKTTDPAARSIITMDPVTHTGIPFQWASLPAAQKTALVSQQILEYIRGEPACEIDYTGARTCSTGVKNLRNRSRPLGDIINSTPVFVSTPDPSSIWTSDASYLAHISAMSSRIPVVYAGANDGMLHGFNAQVDSTGHAVTNTGKELLAYVPSVVYGNLPSLANISYSHKYYVDGSPTVGDAKFGSSWHTILVGGLRSGGQAMFALDITNPGSFSESNASTLALWEFTDNGSGAVGSTGDADLGYTFSEPAIAKMADGNWAAVFGNGYNNTDTAAGRDTRVSATGNAVLYVVNLQTGALLRKIDTGKGRSADPECVGTVAFCSTNGRPNGLAGVRAIDVDSDGVADFVYAGDLFGNMWRFDVTSGTASSWSVSFTGKPLFTTASVDAPSKMQSITVRPTVGAHANGISAGYMVYFGTGKYIEFSDNTSVGQPTQTFYAVWDKWPKGSSTAFTAFTRANLASQTILQDADGMRVTSNNSIDWTAKQGWYMDLIVGSSNNGERVITEALLRSGNILFSTFIPSSAICEYGGSGYLMIIDAFTGSRTYMPPLDINGDTKFTDADKITYGGSLVAASGYKSIHGVPSAASLMESSDGTMDILLMNFADGSAGGIVDHSATDPALRITPSDNFSSGSAKGRISWQRLK